MTMQDLYGSQDRARYPGESDLNYNSYLQGQAMVRKTKADEAAAAAAKAAAPPPGGGAQGQGTVTAIPSTEAPVQMPVETYESWQRRMQQWQANQPTHGGYTNSPFPPASAGQQYGYDEFGRPYSSMTASQGGGQVAAKGEPGTRYNVLSAPGVQELANQYDPQVLNAMLVSLLGQSPEARIGNVRAMGTGLNVEVYTQDVVSGQEVMKTYTLDAAALRGNSPYQASQVAVQARQLEQQQENADLDRQAEMDIAGINEEIAKLQMSSQERMSAGDNRTALAIQKQIDDREAARKGIEDDKFNRQLEFEKEAEKNRQTLSVMQLQESMMQTGVLQTQANTATRAVGVEEAWRKDADYTERYIAGIQKAIAQNRDDREFEYQTWRLASEAQVRQAELAYNNARIDADKAIAKGQNDLAANLQTQAEIQLEHQRQLEERMHNKEIAFQKEQLALDAQAQEFENNALLSQLSIQRQMLAMQQEQQAFDQARALTGEGYEGRRVGLEEELGRGGLGVEQGRLGLEEELGRGGLGVEQGRLGLEGELGRGQLGVQQGQLSVEQFLAALQGELGRGQLGIEQQRAGLEGELGRGQLGVEQGRLGLEGELGRGQLSLAQQQQLMDLMTTLSGQDIQRQGVLGGLDVERGRLGLEQQQQAMDFARNPMTAAAWWNVSGGGQGGGAGAGQGAFAQGAQSGGLQQLGQGGGGAPAQGGGGFPIPQALDQAIAGGGGGLETGGVPEGLIRLLSPQQLAQLQPSQAQLYQALAQMQGIPLEDFMQLLSERAPSQREAQLRAAG